MGSERKPKRYTEKTVNEGLLEVAEEWLEHVRILEEAGLSHAVATGVVAVLAKNGWIIVRADEE